MSRRTFQRRLREQDVTFRKLQAETRFEVARALLLQTDLPIQEVGWRLGYRTPGAFARAFHRWSGVAPREFRSAGRT